MTEKIVHKTLLSSSKFQYNSPYLNKLASSRLAAKKDQEQAQNCESLKSSLSQEEIAF